MKLSSPVQRLTLAAVVAALYAALSLCTQAITFGPIQFRLAEALTVLPFLFPATVPGLFVGCLITNLLSPYGLVDLICGSAATLLAAVWTARMPSRWLAPVPPVLCNAVLVGGMLAWYEAGFGPGFPALFALNALRVGISEAVICYLSAGLLLPMISRLRR